MIYEDKYLKIKQDENGKYHITPIKGWGTVIKSSHCSARTKWGLNRCIKYWMKKGYKLRT